MRNVIRVAVLALLSGCLIAGACGCRKEGPAERAGREIDEATEKAGKEMGKAGEKMRDALKELKK